MYLREKTGLHDFVTAVATQAVPITVAHGDGIGPEIMKASLRVLAAAGAALEIEPIEIGDAVYRAGHSSGIAQASWDSLRRTRVFYKAPITTPQGSGYKSLNVTIRKSLGLYANVRPTVAYAPFVATRHPGMDVVIIRENEEDLYAGIEHRQTAEVYQCLTLLRRMLPVSRRKACSRRLRASAMRGAQSVMGIVRPGSGRLSAGSSLPVTLLTIRTTWSCSRVSLSFRSSRDRGPASTSRMRYCGISFGSSLVLAQERSDG
jgi:hypothetical protein